MRITGLATGLDMDEIIKDSMRPYRIKIQQQQQNKEVVEIKQKLYRDVLKDGREFYNKYFDVAKSDSLLLQKNWSSVSFSSSDDNIVTANGNGNAVRDNYEVSVTELATKATGKIDTSKIQLDSTIEIEGVSLKITEEHVKNPKILASEINEKLVDAKEEKVETGKDLNVKINGKNFKSGSNTITADGITFTINGVTAKNGIDVPVKITGKSDVTELKGKIVNFVNDYNKIMEKLNTVTGTKHDKGYAPLTDEQKKEMSESEIKLWNERVENGQLYKDSDITRIANSMKGTMRSLVGGTKLESIGIKPVGDYSGPLNGTFTIDEDMLTKALEENTEGVMKLFINPPPTEEALNGKTEKEKAELKSQTGIIHQLKDTLNKEFCVSNSALMEKAGYEGTSSFSNNTLTKKISDYENKIKDMEKDFSRKEQALYTKYATLETMMNKLNSQQSNLMSQLGMS